MIYVIVDNRDVDRIDVDWAWLKRRRTLARPLLSKLLDGESVDSSLFAEECNANHCPAPMQKLVAFALGGKSVRIRVSEN